MTRLRLWRSSDDAPPGGVPRGRTHRCRVGVRGCLLSRNRAGRHSVALTCPPLVDAVTTRPSYSTEARREYQRAYRAAGRDNGNKANNRTLPFVGADGEGVTLDNGYHAYNLLRVGQNSIVPRAGEQRLRTEDCLQFLSELPRGVIYVGYFFDYDVTKILEDLGWDRLDRLMNREKRSRQDGRGVFPVDWHDFQVDYLPRKEFKLRRRKGTYLDPITGKEKYEYTSWITINDVGSFFQCRFTEALAKWGVGSDEQRELIGIGKEARASADFESLVDVDKYNAMEIELLEILMEKFRAACLKTGYVPARWQGPGQLAEAMFAKHGVPKTKDIPLLQDPAFESLLEYGRNAFYGGRPEIMGVGPIDRPMLQFDVNGAYPHAMQFLPCLIHGLWEFWDPADGVELPAYDFGLFHGTFEARKSNEGRHTPFWYGLPMRTKEGTITYPGSGTGWYWNFEIAASKHQEWTATKGAWLYHKRCDCMPLGFLQEVYRLRQELGKDDAGIVLKLGGNSCFGKQVQSVGSPKYANPIWGSFITAWCRTMLQKFIHTSEWCTDPTKWCGRDILMVATDSLCTWNSRPDVPRSKDLGGWTVEEHPRGMLIVQPGLYFGSSSKPAKTRGVPRSVIDTMEGVFREAFNNMVSSRSLVAGRRRG